ncbi:hypothetical protein EYF80_065370 [Liparis tanakae]|uniref:Uncharacterized protein n=1 Tax=Liparis tanakae TaxID=230148 RepID=A0A4Z2E780_9TELE|nr:hypothetical protein EYF80_065370 [Liparis tanakae]
MVPVSVPLQVLQAGLRPGPPARLQHGPRGGLQEPGDRPALRRRAGQQLAVLHLQLLQQAVGGEQHAALTHTGVC